MPTVDVDPDELRRLAGHPEKDDEELKADLFALGLEFEGETAEGAFELEFAPDRLDRLSVEGIARSLRYQYGDDRGVYVPDTTDPDWTIEVDAAVPAERPCVTGAVIRGLDLDEAALDSLIRLQEKLHATMGRSRVKGAIGVHDLTMLKGRSATGDGGKSIRYTGIDPEGDTFVPLDGDAEMTPAAVVEGHHIGREYADLVADYERFPAIYDDLGLFSFPPVVNGRRTEVTTDSRDLFVELTGTDQWTIDRMCAILCYALDARGGQVESVRVEYADREEVAADAGAEEGAAGDPAREVPAGVDLVRPDLSTRTKQVAHDRIETTLGVDLEPDDVVDYVERAGMDAEVISVGDDELAYEVTVPPYRVDVLHPVDLVDDVGRAFGFNDLPARYPGVGTVGGRSADSRHEEAVRSQLVGLGYTDLLNFHLVGEDATFERTGVEPGTDVLGGGEPARVTEPYSEEYAIVRTWALPSVLSVLENNTHRAYPQDLAEVGFAAHTEEDEPTNVAERRTVAAAVARHGASYEDAKARLAALAERFGVDLETPPTTHPTFIDGRTASVVLDGEPAGVIGEVHPRVLVAFDLEVPVAAFEFDLAALR